MFSCSDIAKFIDSITDGEFDAKEHVEVTDHLAQCPECRRLVAGRRRIKELLIKSLSVPAPEDLKLRIFAAIKDEHPRTDSSYNPGLELSGASPLPPSNSVAPLPSNTNGTNNNEIVERKTPAPQSSHFPSSVGAFPSTISTQKAAVIFLAAAALLLFAIIPQWTVAPATTEGLSVWEESVDWHRSDIPMEVQGPSVKGVTSWFHGKVNFDVDPLSFGKNANATLVGGRLASVHNRRAALLNYNVDGAHVTVLAFDGKGITVPSDRLQTFDNQKIAVMEGPGYDIALFHKNDITYTITTDLPSSRFEHLIHQVLSSN